MQSRIVRCWSIIVVHTWKSGPSCMHSACIHRQSLTMARSAAATSGRRVSAAAAACVSCGAIQYGRTARSDGCSATRLLWRVSMHRHRGRPVVDVNKHYWCSISEDANGVWRYCHRIWWLFQRRRQGQHPSSYTYSLMNVHRQTWPFTTVTSWNT